MADDKDKEGEKFEKGLGQVTRPDVQTEGDTNNGSGRGNQNGQQLPPRPAK